MSTEPMTSDERDACRALQDKWLSLPVIQHHIRNHGEDEIICGRPGDTNPTFKDVRTLVLPDWREWFSDFFV